ncbi:MAG TPA: M15 family metallopeptidase [Sphingomonas sp.]|nr:M15 family metallopeptidase [Sphingomonas sp.]
MIRSCAILLWLLAAVPAFAQSSDGRLYGHLPYGETAPANLVEAPAGFAVGQPCRVRASVLPDLIRLIAAAHAANLGAELRGVSCYRSIPHQERVFCEAGATDAACVDPAARAESVAPPGHSEHSTGYAIDFGVRPVTGCPDVEPCFAATAVGQWLLRNAPDYGFELSFPSSNAQGVTWEPWHWRWVGTNSSEPGALTARTLFARARRQFPANPRVPAIVVRVVSQPPLPIDADAAIAALPQPLLAAAENRR